MKYTYKNYELNDSELNNIFKISKVSSNSFHYMKKMHHHNHYEIAYFKNMDTVPYIRNVITPNEKYSFLSGSIATIPPNLNHKITISRKSFCERTLINFRYEYIAHIEQYLQININQLFSHLVLHLSAEQTEQIEILIDKMFISNKKNSNPFTNIELKLLFTNFIYILSNSQHTVVPENSDENHITNVIQYIQHNYSDNLTLESLSNIFLTSKYDLCRKIKNYTGTNFSFFLNQIRINHSRELIENSSMTLAEIAEYVGYGTASHFSTTFKKHTGTSPADYKKSIKKQQ